MSESDLMSMPEIGAVTAQQLVAVGIDTPAELRTVGSREAFLRIRERLDPGACIALLHGLEAAVQGVRARDLEPRVKTDLNQWKKDLDRNSERLSHVE